MQHRARSYLVRDRRGFTFLELILVVTVLSLIFAVGIPSLSGLTPKYRIRTAARELGTALEGVRLSALSRGLWMGIHYAITPEPNDDVDGSYYQIIPPAPADYPDLPIEEREFLPKTALPLGVRIAMIRLAGGRDQEFDDGSINILFSPMGNAGSHVVVFEGGDGRFMSLKMNCITGSIEFSEDADLAFGHYEE